MVLEGFDISINTILGISIIALSVVTVLIGTLMLLREKGLKKLLFLLGAVELGYIFIAMGIGIMSPDTPFGLFSLKGGIFHLISASLGFILLIQVALCISYATKKTYFANLKGLTKEMKFTSVFFILSFLTIIGIPPFIGFASKLLIYESIYQINPILSIIAIICNILLLSVFVKVLITNFLSIKPAKSKKIDEAPKSMLFSMGIMATVIIIFSLFSKTIMDYVAQPIVDMLVDNPNYITYTIEFENIEILWAPIMLIFTIILAVVVIFILRGLGQKETIEKTKSKEPKKKDKTSDHVFWELSDSLVWTYNSFEKKIFNRNLGDYIITITLGISFILFIIGVI